MRVLFLIIALTQISWASPHGFLYYGEKFYQNIKDHHKNEKLKNSLFHILNETHIAQLNEKPDLIVPNCPENVKCYRQKSIPYRAARKKLFGYLHLEQSGGEYYVLDVYCQKIYGQTEFPDGESPGPGRIPSPKFINTEHTWPQSRFSKHFPKHLQKGDLHALFPVSSKSNNVRGNIQMGEPSIITNQICANASRGHDNKLPKRTPYFDPPDSHKGNAARALFYFSARYQIPISAEEEKTIKKWHLLDPVDEFEKWRHQKIYEIQKNRNPFIDHPELVHSIKDF